MHISARTGCSMDALLNVTKSAWAIESLDEGWALDAAFKQSKPNFNSNKG